MKTKIIVCLLFVALYVYGGNALAYTEGSNNNYFGTGAGGGGGNDNAFFGAYAGSGQTGSRNTFMGDSAGASNTTGSDNTFLGYNAGVSNRDTNNNTYIGSYAGWLNQSGYDNTFIGVESGYGWNGHSSILIGKKAGYGSSNENIMIGNEAGSLITTSGNYNIFLGHRSGYNNHYGDKNIFIGHHAGYNTDASDNTFIGYVAGNSNTTGYYNTFIGTESGYLNNTGYKNTFLGRASGYYNEGYNNTFLGGTSGYSNTTGNDNTFVGTYSGYSNTTGNNNTFVGTDSGYSNNEGYNNTFLGGTSGYSNTTGNDNTFVGPASGFSNNEGYYNTFLGRSSGLLNTTGSLNTFVGTFAGFSNSTGNNNVFIGYQAGYNETGSNKLYIDNSATFSPLIWGDFSSDIVAINGILGVGTMTPSSPLTVAGVIESTSGGFKFPDASTLTSANTINADTIDGLHSSAFSLSAHLHSGSDITSGTVGESYIDALIARDSEIMPTVLANDGSGSTVDADLLDGQDSTAFMSSSTDNWVDTTGDTMTGALTVDANINTTSEYSIDGTPVLRAESDNTFIGRDAGISNTTGYSNTFVGRDAGFNNTIGFYNTFNGYQAGYNNTTGRYNTFNGYQAGYSNISGRYNSFNGYQAGYSNISGNNNAFYGYKAGYNNTTGHFNTFNGILAGSANTIGAYNTFTGLQAGTNNTEGNNNTFTGYHAGISNTTGNNNSFIGYRAGSNNTTGGNNTFNGYQSGNSNTDGTGNVFLGHNAGYNETGSDKLYIDNSETSSPLIWGDFNLNYVNINGSLGVGTTTPSSPLTVAGVIESTSGGFKFPDASTLTSANTINADTIDGLHSSAFSLSAHLHLGSDITSGTVGESYIDALIARDSEIMPTVLANDGSASTLDADLLDGQDSSAFMTAGTDNWVNATGDTMTGDLSIGANLFVTYDVVVDQDLYVSGNTYVDSDKNLKEDIKPIESSLDKILAIEGVSYKWKDAQREDRQHFGVIAQQVEEVLPEIVKEGHDNKKKVAYTELIPVLIEAVKELKKENNQMSKRITELERELKLKGSMAMANIE